MHLTRERLTSVDSASHCETFVHHFRLIHVKITLAIWIVIDSVGVVNDMGTCNLLEIKSCPLIGVMHDGFNGDLTIAVSMNGNITVCYCNFVIFATFWVLCR